LGYTLGNYFANPSGHPDGNRAIFYSLCQKYQPGLPDGSFSNQKSQFWNVFQGLRLENVDIFYGHLDYFMNIWDIL
jgi:hypothetical protein